MIEVLSAPLAADVLGYANPITASLLISHIESLDKFSNKARLMRSLYVIDHNTKYNLKVANELNQDRVYALNKADRVYADYPADDPRRLQRIKDIFELDGYLFHKDSRSSVSYVIFWDPKNNKEYFVENVSCNILDREIHKKRQVAMKRDFEYEKIMKIEDEKARNKKLIGWLNQMDRSHLARGCRESNNNG